jgi:hypothetical protein
VVTSLQGRIAARLELALLHQERGGFEVPDARRGLATGGPDDLIIRLAVEDVARIAARAVDES